MSEPLIMDIDSEAFAEVRESFNRVLNVVFKKMRTRDSDKSTITLKVDIKLQDVKATDIQTGEIINAKNPEIKYTVSHKLDYKNTDEESGSIQAADSQLVQEMGQWMIRRIDDGQMTIQDYMD